MKSLGAMIKQLSAMVGGSDLTDWEEDFITSVRARSANGTRTQALSERQAEIVERIYRKHFGDAE